MSLFSNIQINHITESMIIRRSDRPGEFIVKYADRLSNLPVNQMRTVVQRLTDYLGSGSHSIEVDIEDDSDTSTFQVCAKMLDCTNAEFLRLSRQLVGKLEQSQTSGRIPDGYVLVVSGTTGDDDKRFICLMKAELHDGFLTDVEANDSSVLTAGMKHATQIFFSPTQKLFKIAVFVEETVSTSSEPDIPLRFAEDFKAFVFDHHLTRVSMDGMARYFYHGFMGCSIAKTSRRLSYEFHRLTHNTINSLPLSAREKVELNTQLFTYLQDPLRSNANVEEFAAYVPEHVRGKYVAAMADQEFPETDVVLDKEMIARKLKNRRLTFDSKIAISGPSNGFEDLVEVIDEGAGYAILRIRGTLTDKGESSSKSAEDK